MGPTRGLCPQRRDLGRLCGELVSRSARRDRGSGQNESEDATIRLDVSISQTNNNKNNSPIMSYRLVIDNNNE